jgi:hypothetical protein
MQISEVKYVFTPTTAMLLLTSCGGSQPPIGAPGAMPQSQNTISTHVDRGTVASYLYVADVGLRAIVAFDAAGNKVVEKSFTSGGAVDVVTDSRGHVYAIVYNSSSYASAVYEYTHSLDRRIAEYHPPGFSTTMTVDAADNLYVQSESAGGSVENIVRYPYGSTQVDHTYSIQTNGPNTEMLGISVRGSNLYTLLVAIIPIQQIIRCSINGTGPCQYYNFSFPPFCGFTTADKDFVYGDLGGTLNKPMQIGYNPMRTPSGDFHRMNLPVGYGFNGYGGCIFHSYGIYAWVPLVSASAPAEVAEIDAHRRVVNRTIGAGYLETPQAAYYGNGFTP